MADIPQRRLLATSFIITISLVTHLACATLSSVKPERDVAPSHPVCAMDQSLGQALLANRYDRIFQIVDKLTPKDKQEPQCSARDSLNSTAEILKILQRMHDDAQKDLKELNDILRQNDLLFEAWSKELPFDAWVKDGNPWDTLELANERARVWFEYGGGADTDCDYCDRMEAFLCWCTVFFLLLSLGICMLIMWRVANKA